MQNGQISKVNMELTVLTTILHLSACTS